MFDSLSLLRKLCGKRKGGFAGGNLEEGLDDVQVITPASNKDTVPSRHQAYGVLLSAGIPSCIWGEDALEHLGVPTDSFCLFLVVPDALQLRASDCLMGAGYQKRQLPLSLSRIPQFGNIYGPPAPTSGQFANEEGMDNPLVDPEDIIDPRHPPVILLPAGEWFVALPETTDGMQDCYPALPQLLTSLISKWLVLEEQDDRLRVRLAVLIEYIYDYLDVVKQSGFEERLPQRLRKFHFERVNNDQDSGELGTYYYQKRFLNGIKGSTDHDGSSVQDELSKDSEAS